MTLEKDKPKEVLTTLAKEIAKKEGYTNYQLDIKDLPGTGGNHLTKLFLISLIEGEKPNLELFAKMSLVTENLTEFPVVQIFERETFALKTLSKEFKNLEDKFKIPENETYQFPKHFATHMTQGEETIVMENLTIKDYMTMDRFKSMDWQDAAVAITTLARFHAMSFVIQAENPTFYEKHIISKTDVFMVAESNNLEPMVAYFESTFNKAATVAEIRHKEKLNKWIADTIQDKNFHFSKPITKGVLNHGDYRQSNILTKYEEGSLTAIVPVDYQMINFNSPVNDLYFLLFLGTDSEFRDKYHKKSLDLYYEKLGHALQLYGQNIKEVYPRQDYERDLRERMDYAMLITLSVLPIVTVEAKEAPKMSSDNIMEDMMNFKFTNDLYVSRLNGILDYFSEQGYL